MRAVIGKKRIERVRAGKFLGGGLGVCEGLLKGCERLTGSTGVAGDGKRAGSNLQLDQRRLLRLYVVRTYRARSLKGHVFDHVRDAAQTLRFIDAADVEGQVEIDHGRKIAHHHNHAQAVLERVFADVFSEFVLRRCGGRGQYEQRPKSE